MYLVPLGDGGIVDLMFLIGIFCRRVVSRFLPVFHSIIPYRHSRNLLSQIPPDSTTEISSTWDLGEPAPNPKDIPGFLGTMRAQLVNFHSLLPTSNDYPQSTSSDFIDQTSWGCHSITTGSGTPFCFQAIYRIFCVRKID